METDVFGDKLCKQFVIPNLWKSVSGSYGHSAEFGLGMSICWVVNSKRLSGNTPSFKNIFSNAWRFKMNSVCCDAYIRNNFRRRRYYIAHLNKDIKDDQNRTLYRNSERHLCGVHKLVIAPSMLNCNPWLTVFLNGRISPHWAFISYSLYNIYN